MKIKITQLGILKNAEIELNDFTLFCGANNTGKTYAMYAIYGLLDFKFEVSFHFVEEITKTLCEEGIYQLNLNTVIEKHFDDIVKNIEKNFHKRLPRLFSTEQDKFKKTEIKLSFDKEKSLNNAIEKQQIQRIHLGKDEYLVFEISKLKESNEVNITLIDNKLPIHILNEEISKFILKLIFSSNLKNAFLLPAERSGVNLLYDDVRRRRTSLFHNLPTKEFNSDFFKDIKLSLYPEPIADYIDLLNSLENLKKNKSKYHTLTKILQDRVIKGSYSIERGKIYFIPQSTKERIALHLASSTVNNLFGLWFYLNHLAEKNDYLMLDEPELSLHPDNQRQVARFLAQLVNSGLKIIVSTHSDYFVRELNNLIMLKNMLKKEFSGVKELQDKYGYQDNELLDGDYISAYLFDDNKITPMGKDDEGIIVETFDKVTNSLNKSSNKIYFAIQDAQELAN